MSAPVSRRRVHEQRRREQRQDALATVAVGCLLGLVGAWLLMLWAVEGGWVQ